MISEQTQKIVDKAVALKKSKPKLIILHQL